MFGECPIDLAGDRSSASSPSSALLPLAAVQSNYLVGVLTVSVIYGIWAASWDFMSGLTGRENFGHALFIGAGAYTAGFLDTSFASTPGGACRRRGHGGAVRAV